MVKLLPKVIPIIMYLNFDIPWLFQFNVTMLAGEKRTCLTSGKAATQKSNKSSLRGYISLLERSS